MISSLVYFISLYQRYLSPDHSAWGKWRHPFGYCHFYPSCSEYAKRAFLTHGLVVGTAKTIWRIFRCNPFSAPAFDPITKHKDF